MHKVKDNLDDIAITSDNYRAILIGSLFQKWFDWLIFINKLNTNKLQFGFQKLASTTMCSWGVNSVVDYYNRASRAFYACAMDLRKAFVMGSALLRVIKEMCFFL